MTLTEGDIVNAIQDYTYLSVQSKAESETIPATNTSANILYASRSRRQGNFSAFYAMATVQIATDEISYNVTLVDGYKAMAYAYLIQYYFERKFKDWNAKSISSGGDSISRDGGSGGSGAWISYLDVFERASANAIDSTIERHTDHTNYPSVWRNIQSYNDDDTDPIKIET